jgi:hypothetical protein
VRSFIGTSRQRERERVAAAAAAAPSSSTASTSDDTSTSGMNGDSKVEDHGIVSVRPPLEATRVTSSKLTSSAHTPPYFLSQPQSQGGVAWNQPFNPSTTSLLARFLAGAAPPVTASPATVTPVTTPASTPSSSSSPPPSIVITPAASV